MPNPVFNAAWTQHQAQQAQQAHNAELARANAGQFAQRNTAADATGRGGLDPSQGTLPWLSQNPNMMDFLTRNMFTGQGAGVGNETLNDVLGRPGWNVGMGLGVGGQAPMNLGMASLAELIFGRGKTDPAALNRNISAINRGTQGNVQDIGDEAQRRGLGGSGLAMALQNSAMGAGASRVAGARADETARAEDRRRQDLALLGDLVIGPSLQSAGIASGVASNNADRSVAMDQARRQQQAAFFGAIASLFGGMGGGG